MESKYILAVNSNVTISFLYSTYLIDASSGPVTLTLPSMAGVGEGAYVNFIRQDSVINNTVTILPTSTTIQGLSSVTVTTGMGIMYDGSEWKFTYSSGSNVKAYSREFLQQYYSLKFGLTDAATIALDWSYSNVQYVVLGGNRTFTFANPVDGGRYILILKQDATGSRTITWPATVLWPGGVAPTLTTSANKVDIITFVYDGTNSKYYGGSNLNY